MSVEANLNTCAQCSGLFVTIKEHQRICRNCQEKLPETVKCHSCDSIIHSSQVACVYGYGPGVEYDCYGCYVDFVKKLGVR